MRDENVLKPRRFLNVPLTILNTFVVVVDLVTASWRFLELDSISHWLPSLAWG